MRSLLQAVLVILFAVNASASASSFDVAEEQIKSQIAHELGQTNLSAKIMTGAGFLRNFSSDNVKVIKLSLDHSKKSFVAIISVDDGRSMQVAGRFFESAKFPTVKRKLRKGDVIAMNDIIYVELESGRSRHDYIMDANELVGKSPTRGLYPERPIASSQVSEPIMVKKNQAVAIIYRNSALTIQGSGTALQEGGIGETIRVRNESSGAVVTAKITSEGVAEIAPRANNFASLGESYEN